MQRKTYKDIDEYIADYPKDVQKILGKIRATIKKAAPQAKEAISYQIPTFNLHGYLIYFAAYKKHIGVYPAPMGVAKFKKDLARYGSGKGTLKFPLDEPIPYDLIAKVVEFRAKQNLEKAKPRVTTKSRVLK